MYPGFFVLFLIFVRPHLVPRVHGEGYNRRRRIGYKLTHHGRIKAAYLRFFFMERFFRLFLAVFLFFLRPPIIRCMASGTAPAPWITLRFVRGYIPSTGRIISAVGAVEKAALKAGPSGR